MGTDLTGETNHDAGAEADQRLPDTDEEADEPDDHSRATAFNIAISIR